MPRSCNLIYDGNSMPSSWKVKTHNLFYEKHKNGTVTLHFDVILFDEEKNEYRSSSSVILHKVNDDDSIRES